MSFLSRMFTRKSSPHMSDASNIAKTRLQGLLNEERKARLLGDQKMLDSLRKKIVDVVHEYLPVEESDVIVSSNMTKDHKKCLTIDAKVPITKKS